MKVNFNKQLIGLDGTPIFEAGATPVNIGKALGQNLVMVTQGDILKHHDWGMAIYKNEDLDLDSSDVEYLKTFIKNSQTLFILTKKQLLECFEQKQE